MNFWKRLITRVVTAILIWKASRLYRNGRYEQVIRIAHRACELARKVIGENDPGYACSLSFLAWGYEEMGAYTTAEPLHRKATSILRQTLGERDSVYIGSLNSLGDLYYAMGNYAAAEPLYLQALDILSRAGEKEYELYALSLENLAMLYSMMDNYDAAELLFFQASETIRKVLGEEHPRYTQILLYLAFTYLMTGNSAGIVTILSQLENILPEALNNGSNIEINRILNGVAVLYLAVGSYNAAESLLRSTSNKLRKIVGEEHEIYAGSLGSLAKVYLAEGNYNAAEPLLRQKCDIMRKALGEEHPRYAASLNEIAELCAATDRSHEAMTLMLKAAAIDMQMISQVFSIASETQRMVYLTTHQQNLDVFLSLVLHMPDFSAAVAVAFELVLRRKAIGAEALAAQRDAVLGGRYPALQAQLQELTTWRRQIAQKMLAGPGPEGLAAHQQLLTEWSAHRERLEEELVRQIPEMNLEQALHALDCQTVAQALPEHSALVEFVRFNIFDFKAVPARYEPQWLPAHYLAFVLPAGSPDNVQMIDLGDAASVEQMIARFRATFTGGARTLTPVQGLPLKSANDGADLRRIIFDPLLPTLAGCTRLFLAPDGDLTRLPFEALPTDDGRRLIDEYHFSYLSVGRDLLRIGATFPGEPAASVVVADPDFDFSGEGLSTADEARALTRQSRALNPAAIHFDPLPGTRVEGTQVATQLGVQPWLKDTALEEKLKSSISPRILHIATHGFFLEDQQRDPNEMPLGMATFGGNAESPFGRLGHAMENPLLRSGLALAGANTWLAGQPLPEDAGDGILHAEDVSGLDLIDTELVVLSACETGLGEIQVGEGVLGLRRAFVLAGAKTLVMSLWKVPDQQTQELMDEFYRRILAGEGRAEALRSAQLMMKAKYPNPLYWGAFICQGDPGPLAMSSQIPAAEVEFA